MTLLASAAVSVVRVPERRGPHQARRAPVPFLTRGLVKPAADTADAAETPEQAKAEANN